MVFILRTQPNIIVFLFKYVVVYGRFHAPLEKNSLRFPPPPPFAAHPTSAEKYPAGFFAPSEDLLRELMLIMDSLGPDIITDEFCRLLGETLRDHPLILHTMQRVCPSLKFLADSQSLTVYCKW